MRLRIVAPFLLPAAIAAPLPAALAGAADPLPAAVRAAPPPALAAAAAPGPAAPAIDPRLLALLPGELQGLARDLQAHGFRLRLASPPAAGAYGQFVPASRTLWVAPIAFDLGIGRQTFLHEAVHAVQSCPSGRLTPIGWRFRLDPVVSREISGILVQRYHHGSRLLEQEAFGLQGQPDAVPLLRAALRSRCRPGS